METQATTHSASHHTAATAAQGARLVAADGRSLPLQGTEITVDAQGGIARTTLRQTFLNSYDEALHVTYALPLPAEGAVSGFSFTRDGHKIVGEIDTKQKARKRFARAIASGRTAAMIEQDRVNQFTQKVGNIPAGAVIICEILVDQKLVWLPEGAWEWRFPTVVPSRYMGQEGRVTDRQKIDAPLSTSPLKARSQLDLLIRDGLAPGGRPSSPSHQLESQIVGSMCQIGFSDAESGRLNRDVVVRWPVVTPDVGLQLHVARPPEDGKHDSSDAFGLLTLVPPDVEADTTPVARDLIVLLDTSGSMGGRPLQQAQAMLSAMIRTLQPHDQIELIEFSSAPRRWQREPCKASPENKKAAIQWLQGLHAGGCTEMHEAILEALQPLRDNAQRQIVLVTDGYIGFENEILAAIHKHLPTSTRLHAIGVGDSVNRALTEPVARAGAGVEIILGIDEPVEPAIHRLLARTEAPLVTELMLVGDGVIETAPTRLPDLFAGAPVLLSARLNPAGGSIEVEGYTADGPFSHTVVYPAIAAGHGNQAITALYGRETINDLEAWRASTDLSNPRSREQLKELDASIEKTGLRFQLATRFTSWIAVDEEIAVEPEGKAIEETMPHELPHGTSIASLGLRAASAVSQPTTTIAMGGLGASMQFAAMGAASQTLPSNDSTIKYLDTGSDVSLFIDDEDMDDEIATAVSTTPFADAPAPEPEPEAPEEAPQRDRADASIDMLQEQIEDVDQEYQLPLEVARPLSPPPPAPRSFAAPPAPPAPSDPTSETSFADVLGDSEEFADDDYDYSVLSPKAGYLPPSDSDYPLNGAADGYGPLYGAADGYDSFDDAVDDDEATYLAQIPPLGIVEEMEEEVEETVFSVDTPSLAQSAYAPVFDQSAEADEPWADSSIVDAKVAEPEPEEVVSMGAPTAFGGAPEKSRSSALTWLLILLQIALLVALGWGIYWLVKG